MITFIQDMVIKGGFSKRIYGSHDEREASEFAHKYKGIHYEYLPSYWRIII